MFVRPSRGSWQGGDRSRGRGRLARPVTAQVSTRSRYLVYHPPATATYSELPDDDNAGGAATGGLGKVVTALLPGNRRGRAGPPRSPYGGPFSCGSREWSLMTGALRSMTVDRARAGGRCYVTESPPAPESERLCLRASLSARRARRPLPLATALPTGFQARSLPASALVAPG
jgi:hypothetical protein